MANRHRGEIEAMLDGKLYRMCLTLGALAELEDAFGADDMVALARRFEEGRMRSRDAMKIIGAGLRGGGSELGDEAVSSMQAEGGASGYVDIVARLLRATFSAAGAVDADTSTNAAEASEHSGPFPGTT